MDIPNLLMHAMAVVLSEKTFKLILRSLTNHMILKRMAFNSRTFICKFFSVLIHDPLIGIPSQYASYPCIDASVQVTFVIPEYCSFFNTACKCFIHHCRSRIASFINLMGCQSFPLLFSIPRFYAYPDLGNTGVQTYFLERSKLKFQ